MTKIEWCDITLNPIVGCSHCSPGCLNCYAEKFAARLAKNPKTATKYAGVVDEHGKWTGKLSEEGWDCLATLTSIMHSPPKRIFLGSMTDMFHENMDQVSFNTLIDDMTYIGERHTFLLLTKRPAHALEMVLAYENGSGWARDGLPGHESHRLPKNVWLGVTVCNQKEANEKLPILMKIPAAKRFVSVEPMIEAVNLSKYLEGEIACQKCGKFGLSSSDNEGAGNRCTRANMESRLSEMEPLDATNAHDPMQKKACREIIREIPASKGNDKWDSCECPRSSACMDTFQRYHSTGADNQSQKRESLGQSARESGVGDIFTTTTPFLPCSQDTSQTGSSGAISWVICGAETGPGARPMDLQWARDLKDQCKNAQVPFFFKKCSPKQQTPDDLMVREFPE